MTAKNSDRPRRRYNADGPTHTEDIVPRLKRIGQAVFKGTVFGAILASAIAVAIGANYVAVIVTGLAIGYLGTAYGIKEMRTCSGQTTPS